MIDPIVVVLKRHHRKRVSLAGQIGYLPFCSWTHLTWITASRGSLASLPNPNAIPSGFTTRSHWSNPAVSVQCRQGFPRLPDFALTGRGRAGRSLRLYFCALCYRELIGASLYSRRLRISPPFCLEAPVAAAVPCLNCHHSPHCIASKARCSTEPKA